MAMIYHRHNPQTLYKTLTQQLIVLVLLTIIIIGAVVGNVLTKSNKQTAASKTDDSADDLLNKLSKLTHKDCSSCSGETPDIVLIATIADTRVEGVTFRRRVFCEGNASTSGSIFKLQ